MLGYWINKINWIFIVLNIKISVKVAEKELSIQITSNGSLNEPNKRNFNNEVLQPYRKLKNIYFAMHNRNEKHLTR